MSHETTAESRRDVKTVLQNLCRSDLSMVDRCVALAMLALGPEASDRALIVAAGISRRAYYQCKSKVVHFLHSQLVVGAPDAPGVHVAHQIGAPRAPSARGALPHTPLEKTTTLLPVDGSPPFSPPQPENGKKNLTTTAGRAFWTEALNPGPAEPLVWWDAKSRLQVADQLRAELEEMVGADGLRLALDEASGWVGVEVRGPQLVARLRSQIARQVRVQRQATRAGDRTAERRRKWDEAVREYMAQGAPQ